MSPDGTPEIHRRTYVAARTGGVTTKQRLLEIEAATAGTTEVVPCGGRRLPGLGS